MQVESITYVMNCEKTNCVNSHHPIVLKIEKELIKTFDNMLDEMGLIGYFLPMINNQRYSTHIQYIDTFGVIDLVEIKSSIQETIRELHFPIVDYRLMIKNPLEIPFDNLIIFPYSYPHLYRLTFYQQHKII